jgi:hypothetical protein
MLSVFGSKIEVRTLNINLACKNSKHLIVGAGVSLSTLIQSPHVVARTLTVDGYFAQGSYFLGDGPEETLADDPVIGRQTCPSLLRLNAKTKKFETILLKELPVVAAVNGSETWQFELKNGLKWWSGSTVTTQDLTKFLIDHASAQFGADLGSKDIKVISDLKLEVHWTHRPKYGPYAVMNLGFHRAQAQSGPLKYECAGLYKVSEITRERLVLTLSSGYSAKFDRLEFVPNGRSKGGESIKFFTDSPLEAPLATAKTNVKNPVCSKKMELPIATVIAWNAQSKTAGHAFARRGLTHLLPRGEMMRTIAGEEGVLISAPILRSSPFYNPRHGVLSYSIDEAVADLKKANIVIPSSKDNDSLRLKLATLLGAQSKIIQKVIEDSFALAGIESSFVDGSKLLKTGKMEEEADGILAGVQLPWSGSTLKRFFKSKDDRLNKELYTWVKNPSFAASLDAIDFQVSWGHADGPAHNRFHDLFAEEEPWSLLMLHQSCVAAEGLKVELQPQASDPDWFRRVVVN